MVRRSVVLGCDAMRWKGNVVLSCEVLCGDVSYCTVECWKLFVIQPNQSLPRYQNAVSVDAGFRAVGRIFFFAVFKHGKRKPLLLIGREHPPPVALQLDGCDDWPGG